MLSLAKLAANRGNATKSRGPQTKNGIAVSSGNALTHGLSAARTVVIEGSEDSAEYEALRNAVVADLEAQGAVEVILAERFAQIVWRLWRVMRFESERLSQWNWDALPSLHALSAALERQAKRKKVSLAIGQLFLAEDAEIDGETVGIILDAVLQCLNERERSAFCGPDSTWVTQIVAGQNLALIGQRLTVGRVLEFLRAAEGRLKAIGPPAALREVSALAGADPPNLIALVYQYYVGIDRVETSLDEGAARGLSRAQTEALLLQLDGAGIVDRYEPKLRRDLSRTLKDLLELQERRREVHSNGYDPSATNIFSQNEPTRGTDRVEVTLGDAALRPDLTRQARGG